MKALLLGLALTALALTGCSDKPGKAGGPGATNPDSKTPLIGLADDTFTVSGSTVSIKPGDTEPSSATIKRGTNFGHDVSIAFTDLPKGVTVNPGSPTIKSSETEARFQVIAGEDATPGDYTVLMTGHPKTGSDATNQFQLKIGKKDTFTLSMPFWTTALKQGETRLVMINISRDKRFDQDVALKFDTLPKGVTVEPASPVIKNGEAGTQVSLIATPEAPLGDFAVKVTGHPAKGADAVQEFKFGIAKK